MFEEFLVTNSAENPKKMLTKFVEKEPIPRNFMGAIPKIFSRVPQEYLEIFTIKSSE